MRPVGDDQKASLQEPASPFMPPRATTSSEIRGQATVNEPDVKAVAFSNEISESVVQEGQRVSLRPG